MSSSFPDNDTFQNHFEQMLSLIKAPQSLTWSRVMVVEYASIIRGRVARIPRSALFTAEAYEKRFDWILSQGHHWVNMSALGVLADTLIVEIAFPTYVNHVPRNKLSVNYSRSMDNRWDLSDQIEIVEDVL